MRKTLRVFTLALLPILTLVLGWQLGVRYQHMQMEAREKELEELFSAKGISELQLTDPEQEVDLALFWGVWRLLLKNYIELDKLQPQTMLFGAVGGLVEALDDPYTVFMTPSDNKEFREALRGQLQGIGAELTLRDGLVVIVAPLKGSPASKAGLRPEDVIVKVNGTPTKGASLQDVVHRIRGPKGTEVNISIRRDVEVDLREFTIVRDEITVPSVEHEVKETGSGSVGYIAINQFGEHTTREVNNAILAFQTKDIEGLIIDVRYNGGGYLERAVELVSMFLRNGKVVTVSRRDGDPVVHYVHSGPAYQHIVDEQTPMVVLINEGSASASEILAGALQDHERATVIGKTSFGKGTIQEIFELPGGSSLRVTIAKWLTPNGTDLGQEGVHPDIEVDRTIEDIEDEQDPQLNAALEWLLDDEDVTIADEIAEIIEE